MWQECITATTIDEVIEILAESGPLARIIAGGTDLMVELEQKAHKDVNTIIDISRINGQDEIFMDENKVIHLSPMVTHNQCIASQVIVERAFPLAQAALQVGSPQIRNRGTVAGNLITASPANDTITPLLAMGAKVTLRSKSGNRILPLEEFYIGVRNTIMKPDEMLVDISFPALDPQKQRGGFVKLGLREAQAIAVINVAIVLTMDGNKVISANITLGAVAPTVIHAVNAERFLIGNNLDERMISQVAVHAMEASKPIDDIRGSANYRREMVRVFTQRLLEKLSKGEERKKHPMNPILLASGNGIQKTWKGLDVTNHKIDTPIHTRINGKAYTVIGAGNKSLLRMIREDLLLVGTKEACAEGECGACTVILDGMAVMSCLIPAPRAHGAEITTIEGVSGENALHPVQEAFVQHGAVQCGYCTPGFIMSGVMLLDERPHPTRDEIIQALTGNLCRCTGYHKIIKAIEHAGLTNVE